MLDNTTNITPDALLNEAAVRLGQKCRFVTLTCLDLGGEHEIFYHFDRDYQLFNLRVMLTKGQTLPSITSVCPAAVIVENELQDLFGIKVTGLAVDFGGKLLLTDACPAAPQNKVATPAANTEVAK